MEEAIDIITSFSGEPRGLRRASTSLRSSVLQNDRAIYEGILRKYKTGSIYEAARQAILADDINTISKLVLQYSGQLPIPWSYLSQFVKSPRMAELIIRKLDNLNNKEKRNILIGKFRLKDYYDSMDASERMQYICSDNMAFLSDHAILYCLTPESWKKSTDDMKLRIVNTVLQQGDPQLLLDIGLSIPQIVLYRTSSTAPANIPWMLEHGVPLLPWDDDPESPIYLLENSTFEDYLKISSWAVIKALSSFGSRIMKTNNPKSLDIASGYPGVKLYTPEQILKAIQHDLMDKPYYGDKKMLEAAYDLVLDKSNAVQYAVYAFDTTNIELQNALLQVLELKGLHPDWIRYYIGYNVIPKPTGIDSIFWKQLLTAAIKKPSIKISIRIINRAKGEIDPSTANNLRNFISRSELGNLDRRKLIEML